MADDEIPVTIIGGGVVGVAIAYEFSSHLGEDAVFLLEKNNVLGAEQSGRSSEVLHCGFFQEGLKRELCLEGNRRIHDFCREHDVPLLNTGKLIVAKDQQETVRLERLVEEYSGIVPGLRMLDSQREIRQYELHLRVSAAAYAPTTATMDTATYLQTLAMMSRSRGTRLYTNHEVIALEANHDHHEPFRVVVKAGGEHYSFNTRFLINAAGLYADNIATMLNPDNKYVIIPRKAEYVEYRNEGRFSVGRSVYPVPQQFQQNGRMYRHVGVHLTPTHDCRIVRVGPLTTPLTMILSSPRHGSEHHNHDNAEDGDGDPRQEYGHSYTEEQLNDTFLDKLEGFFTSSSSATSADVLDRAAFRREMRPLLSPGHVGLLAEQNAQYDFTIAYDAAHPSCLHLLGIDSPGLTSSLAIASYVWEKAKERL